MEAFVYLIFAPLLLIIPLGIIAIWISFKGKLVTIENERTRYNPDGNGNLPAYYDPKTGNVMDFLPGNTRYPENVYYIQPGPANSSKGATTRAIKVNETSWDIRVSTPEPTTNNNERSLDVEPTANVLRPEAYLHLLTSKREGKPKASSIKAITGISKGSSSRYKEVSDIWDNMQ
jgi:hypothetical protein